MIATRELLKTACLCLLTLAVPGSIQAQTYKVGADNSVNSQAAGAAAQSNEQSLGFGSNIQNARLARSAEQALARGDHALALNYAERAAQAAPNDPQLWLLLGYAARLAGRYSQSADAYSRSLRLSPGSLQALSGLAQTYSQMGRTGEAERLLKQVIAADPRRRDDALLLGDLYMRSGDYAGAINWVGRAERMQPDARSELLLALSYQHTGQMDQARRYLDMARHRAPNNPDIQRSLAGYYRETGNYRDAIAALESIRNPQPDVVAELAYTYQLNGQPADAARLYERAASARPRDLNLQLSAAQAEIAAGSVESAAPFLDRARDIDVNYYRLHAIQGEIAQLEEHDSDAAREYSAAIDHLPASPVEGPLYSIQLHMNLEELDRNLELPDQAAQQLQIAQTEINALDEQGADRTTFLRLRALIKMNAGQVESALADMKEALAISPRDPNNLQLDGDLLMKLGRTAEAIAVYKRVLAIDPRSRYALTSLGYASRAAGNDRDAERYFERLARDYPNLYVPYLALGDLYTARGEYPKAQAAYRKGYAVAPQNALIVAGGMGAAIEAHNFPLAGTWNARVTPRMEAVPHILRERERYLSFKGNYEQSAELGRRALAVLSHDRDVVVYLGYDLLNLQKYDELLALTARYMDIFPREPDLPLLAGYVHKQYGQREQALKDFSEALKRDPNVTTAYVNRGYILNDLHQPGPAAADFEAALKREPNNGTARLGLAFADLNLNRLHAAIQQSQLAQNLLGDSEPLHIIRATAYGRQGFLTKAIAEYQAALKFNPQDGSLYLGIGNALFAERRYHEAIQQYETAEKLLPRDAGLYAMLARSYASLNDREQTLKNVRLAEQYAAAMPAPVNDAAPRPSDIYISTGEALNTLGDQSGAMDRFSKALLARESNRVSVRLAIAQLMAQQGHSGAAERQVALAQLEAAAGDTAPPTGEQYIQAADLFQQMHEYQLSQSYLNRAKDAGASDTAVRVGLANNYLALGDTQRAAAELAAVKNSSDSQADYQYLLAQANLYQQEHQGTLALSSFAEAASAAGEDQTAEQSLLQAGANEGYRINSRLSVLSNLIVQPIYEDSTIYVLDAKVLGPVPVPPNDFALLPPPRSSLDTEWTNAFHLHLGNFPTIGGFFQLRNVRGLISVPSANSIQNRDTTDYSFNVGVNPTIHLGRNALTFDSGVQATIRRDSRSPLELNQNLRRVFTYMTTSSFFNAVSVSGYGVYETGPFTEIDLHSSAVTGALDFRVGRPWSKTALVTGWGLNDQNFSPNHVEDYFTSSYIGLSHRFSERWSAEAIAEDLRAFRVFGGRSGIAQELRPAGTVSFAPTRHWSVQASTAYASTRSFHVYDTTQNGVSISYTRALNRTYKDAAGTQPLAYPIRFAAGFQQETFFNFNHGSSQQFRPYVSITLF